MKYNKIFVVVIAALIFSVSPPAWGDDDDKSTQVLQEVFQTEVVYPQEKGEVQMTWKPRFQEGDARDAYGLLPLTIEYGLSDAWQIELEADALRFAAQVAL